MVQTFQKSGKEQLWRYKNVEPLNAGFHYTVALQVQDTASHTQNTCQFSTDTESIQEMYAELYWNSSQKTNRKKLLTVKYVYVYTHKYF